MLCGNMHGLEACRIEIETNASHLSVARTAYSLSGLCELRLKSIEQQLIEQLDTERPCFEAQAILSLSTEREWN